MSLEIKVTAEDSKGHQQVLGPLHPADWDEANSLMSVYLDFLKAGPKHAAIHGAKSHHPKGSSVLVGTVQQHGRVKQEIIIRAHDYPVDLHDRIVGALKAIVRTIHPPSPSQIAAQTATPASLPPSMSFAGGLLTCTTPASGGEWGFFNAGPSQVNVSVLDYGGSGNAEYAFFPKSQLHAVHFVGSPTGSSYFSFNPGWPTGLPTDIKLDGNPGMFDGGLILAAMVPHVTTHLDPDDFIIVRP